MGARLNRHSALPAQARPLVAPGSFRAGIVHLGVGAFHRAHQAVYTEAAMAASGGDWGIAVVAPSSRSTLDILAEQDYLFSVATIGEQAAGTRVISALCEGRHGGDRAGVLALLADPAISVITLTVTEKAYRPSGPLMQLLAAGLRARGGAPVTVLSCDNLPANGTVLANVLGALTPGLTGVTYPSSMVDRIVPATAPSLLERVAAELGYLDLAAVAAEPFLQWVIEDKFAAGRPDWAAAGAQFTDDVTPWEHLKLRALNGVHSALAYLGALAGCETIAAALTLPSMAELLRHYVATEVAGSMTPPPGVDVVGYGEEALGRFSNAALGHRTLQVAMDGTQKLPQRLLSVLNTVPDPRLATLIAAGWAEFASSDHPLDDPLAAQVRRDLSTEALFGPAGVLPVPNPDHRAMIDVWRRDLSRHGAAATIAATARALTPPTADSPAVAGFGGWRGRAAGVRDE
jgi:fructuronate reductase